MGMNINSGGIYPIDKLDDLLPGDVLLDERMKNLLEGVPANERFEMLKESLRIPTKFRENERRRRQIENGTLKPTSNKENK